MVKHSQKDGIYHAVTSFLIENDRPFDDGQELVLSSDDKKTITTMIVTAIQVGAIEFSAKAAAKYDTLEKIRNYTTGLLSNWLRKDKRLNGGEKHTIKKPGSRAGQGDSIVKSLKKLRKALVDKKEIALVDNEIEARCKQLQNK